MASPTVPIECGIYLEEYNDTTRRPRALPCTHNFCGLCLQKSIDQGGNMCSICRKEHTATSIVDIPINTDLEKFIKMWSLMSLSTNKANKTCNDEEDFCPGYCSRHSKSLLYFKCRTHSIDICRECTVIQHSPSKCDIVELKDEAMCKKEATKNKALKVIDHLNSETTSLEMILREANESIVSKQANIESLLKEIDEESIVCDETQSYISENNSFVSQLQGYIEKIDKASTNKNINKECTEIENKIEASEKCSHKMEKYFSKLLLMDPESAMKFMKEKRIDVFAVDGENRVTSSKLLSMNGGFQFSSLEKNIRPTANSTMMPVSSLLSVVGMQPIVYLDLMGGNHCDRRRLGRVRIRLTCNPKRQEQMLHLFTGMKGQSFKGSWFDTSWNVGGDGEGLGCYGYNTLEVNSSETSTVQEQECEQHIEGNVTGFIDDANFMICTRTKPVIMKAVLPKRSLHIVSSSSWTAPEIGHVVSGLGILRKALSQYATHDIGPFYNASEIRIFDTGVEIPTHQQRKSSEPQHGESDATSTEDTTWAKDNRNVRNYQYITEPFSKKLQLKPLRTLK